MKNVVAFSKVIFFGKHFLDAYQVREYYTINNIIQVSVVYKKKREQKLTKTSQEFHLPTDISIVQLSEIWTH